MASSSSKFEPPSSFSPIDIVQGCDKLSDTICINLGSYELKVGFSSSKVAKSIPCCLSNPRPKRPLSEQTMGSFDSQMMDASASRSSIVSAGRIEPIQSLPPMPSPMQVSSDEQQQQAPQPPVLTPCGKRDKECQIMRRQLLYKRGKISRRDIYYAKLVLGEEDVNDFSNISLEIGTLLTSPPPVPSSPSEIGSSALPTLFGTEALTSSPTEYQDAFFPIQRGRFHTTALFPPSSEPPSVSFSVDGIALGSSEDVPLPQGGAPRSLSQCADSLYLIIRNALSQICPSIDDIQRLKAVVVIPDSFDRNEINAIADISLKRLKFSSLSLLQESVASVFAYGTPSLTALIVDIGDQKTSLSFVDEGIASPKCRAVLPYGGYDLARSFLAMTQRFGGGPKHPLFQQLSMANPAHAYALRSAVENHCHISEGEEVFDFVELMLPSLKQRMRIRSGDQLLISSLGFLYPKVLLPLHTYIPGASSVDLTAKQQLEIPIESVDEDPYNEEFVYGSAYSFITSAPSSSLESGAAADGVLPPAASGAVSLPAETSLDAAIVSCLESQAVDMFKRKFLPHILLIGGCAALRGFRDTLHSAVKRRLDAHPLLAQTASTMHLISAIRDLDSRHVAWKGGCIASFMSGPEAWIDRMSYETHGFRAIRERITFSLNADGK